VAETIFRRTRTLTDGRCIRQRGPPRRLEKTRLLPAKCPTNRRIERQNPIRNFPPEILTLVTRSEIGLLYVDTVVSGVVLLLCLVRLVRDILEGL
jgi:hypothetical protein